MAEISAKLVKELRDKTGAGMMDCKKALSENNGDIEKSIEWLRQKGISSAEKKVGRTAAEGLVHSYIHFGGRIGVLVEVNCETDFVARGEKFKELVNNVAMQIAACPNVEYIKVADIPTEISAKEKEIEMGRDDLGNKPENIKEKIVQGRIEKRLKELALMEQPFIKDQNLTIEELVKQSVAELGENIQIRRFVRFNLGEGIEKETMSFADEVAAATGQTAGTATEAKTEEAPKAEEPKKGSKKKK
ncbi:MAG: translation elongation factor Ts [Snowella sp.]|nr:translation elongation factor Ts [Snowella sp.]